MSSALTVTRATRIGFSSLTGGGAMSLRVDQIALVVVSVIAGLTASELKGRWAGWGCLYAVVLGALRLVPAREQPPEPADL